MLCQWDPAGDSLLGLSEIMPSAEDFLFDGNDMYIWSGRELDHVVLE